MRMRTIGSLTVSEVGLGCNNFGMTIDERRTQEVVDAAIDAGITFFDTADIYGGTKSEAFLGKALGTRRSRVVVATKFGLPVDERRQGAHPEYVRRAVEDSLKRLNTDVIDLYQLHKPDPTVPIADTLGALDGLVRAGKVREIGCSNFSVAQIREARQAVAAGAFVSVQNEYSLLKREAEADVLPECERTGLAFLPYFPLASGLLTGKYRKGAPAPEGSRLRLSWASKALTDENLAIVERLTAIAERHGHTLLELSVSWLLRWRSVASVIAGATRPDQVRANAAAANWTLDDRAIADINAVFS
jgi:aryl-alcohol dehydrogenase-like predicted oxidoreductase